LSKDVQAAKFGLLLRLKQSRKVVSPSHQLQQVLNVYILISILMLLRVRGMFEDRLAW